MSELRHDQTTEDWVVIAPERGLRPHDARPASPDEGSKRDDCPFCPGNERETPPETWRLPGPRGTWRARAFANRFPIVESERGRHEVIVESPHHDWDLATGSEQGVRRVLRAYRARYLAMRSLRPSLVVLFRNHGLAAGTSLEHPHSQVVALPIVPALIRRRLEVARQQFDETGNCLYEEMLERAIAEDERIVRASERYAAFVPYAASVPFETWISPRRHQSSFGALSDEGLGELAGLLWAVLRGLRQALNDPPYNLVIDSVPPADEQVPYFGWVLRIVPRLTTAAGFELATAIPVNPSLPESDASSLRGSVTSLVAGHGPAEDVSNVPVRDRRRMGTYPRGVSTT